MRIIRLSFIGAKLPNEIILKGINWRRRVLLKNSRLLDKDPHAAFQFFHFKLHFFNLGLQVFYLTLVAGFSFHQLIPVLHCLVKNEASIIADVPLCRRSEVFFLLIHLGGLWENSLIVVQGRCCIFGSRFCFIVVLEIRVTCNRVCLFAAHWEAISFLSMRKICEKISFFLGSRPTADCTKETSCLNRSLERLFLGKISRLNVRRCPMLRIKSILLMSCNTYQSAGTESTLRVNRISGYLFLILDRLPLCFLKWGFKSYIRRLICMMPR